MAGTTLYTGDDAARRKIAKGSEAGRGKQTSPPRRSERDAALIGSMRGGL